MTATQLMIDQLEARAKELDFEIETLEIQLMDLTTKGRHLSQQAEALKEKRNHYAHAASNLKAVHEIENPLPAEQVDADVWGDAG